MDRIAAAEGAEWIGNESGYELTRSHKAALAQAREEDTRRIAFLRKDIEGEVASKASEGNASDPGARLAWSTILKLGPEALAGMPGDTRIVWSSTPNRRQRPLPFAAEPLIRTYLEQLRKAKLDERVRDSETATAMEVSGKFGLLSGYLFTVTLKDSQGKVLYSSTVMMSPSGPNALTPPPQGSTPSRRDEAPLELSATAQSVRKLMRDLLGGHTTGRTPAFDEVIFHPEKYDPLSLFPSNAVSALAKRRSRALVAVLPDVSLWTGIFIGSEKLYADEIQMWLTNMCEVDESKPGWMVVRPLFPIEARLLRANRDTMGAFFRRAQGGVTLSDLAEYIATQPRSYFDTASYIYSFLCVPEVVQMCDMSNLGGLRTYGALTPRQRTALERGASLPITDLSSEAKAEMVEWAYSNATYVPSEGMVEPTGVLPDGLPLSTALSAHHSSEAEVVPLYNGKENPDGSPMSAAALGSELVRQSNGNARIKEPITGFRLGQRLTMNLILSAAPATFGSTLNEHRIDRKGAPLTLAALPEAFRKDTEAARQQAIKEWMAGPPKSSAKP